jgi:hypothetical protein
MRNNRNIYNTIISDVSKIVKRRLEEAADTKTEVEVAADKLISDLKKNNKDLETCIDLMKIISKGQSYEEVSFDKLIPELEKRLKDKSINDNFRTYRRIRK